MAADRQWITTPINRPLLRGAIELETTSQGLLPHRLPGWARAQCADPLLAMVESQPSGVRLVFRTRATAIELDVLPTRRIYAGFPPRPDGIYDLCVDGRLVRQSGVAGGNVMHVDMATGSVRCEAGVPGTLSFDGLTTDDKLVEIWLPHNEMAELVALRTDAPVAAIEGAGLKTWLHHGSSISHGSDAASPTGTWPAIAAALAGVSLVNLGLGGNALLDPFTARTIRDTPADLISVKLGINLVNTDAMRLRAFGPAVHGFLDTIREGHPTAPLLVASPILCPIHEATPGPTAPELADGRLLYRAAGDPCEVVAGKLTLEVIRDGLSRIVAQRALADPNIHYLDGRVLYGEADHAALPLPDRLHPDAVTHRLIGERFAELAFASAAPLDPAQGKADRISG
ncbi:GDSL-type esterase/lipase family protein [Sphingomonas colocasiae]|uniref:SGNH hydrolase-type esterase domain-containing protein n=1 Tax=Sphingomonas colocasiae TaxID=1848973 RepID=A0ABS7PXP7_9SPHN|nr:SGNH/GDSL hydrolase family protein [Sphingomonas colocasiae]MBY8825739.1 hypothetical protein [Sphingomonas colocasiae]